MGLRLRRAVLGAVLLTGAPMLAWGQTAPAAGSPPVGSPPVGSPAADSPAVGAQAPAVVAPAQVPANAAADEASDIVVVGQNGDKTRLTADSLRDAAQAYAANRAEFAPLAPFRFEIRNPDPAILTGLTVYLRHRKRDRDGGYQTRDLPVDALGRFTLPVELVQTGDWELRTSPNRAGLRIAPLMLSPGSEFADWRMGDLRLQCRVSVAFARISAPLRLLVAAVNPCDSRSIGFYATSRQPLLRAEIVGRDLNLLSVKRPESYLVPLSDKSVSNDDRLRLTYK